MKKIIKVLNKHTQYIILENNKLYLKKNNVTLMRIRQKLPEYIADIDELKRYDYKFSKNKKK